MRIDTSGAGEIGQIECIHVRPFGQGTVLQVLKKDNLYTIIKSESYESYDFCKVCQYLLNSRSKVWWYSFSHAQNLLQTLNDDLFFPLSTPLSVPLSGVSK